MKIENSELEAFVAVAELGNFQRAADKLHLTQPGLSRRIFKLEQALGVKLFQRTTRSVSLTGVGRHFLPMARKQIAQLDTMLSSVKEIADKRFGKIKLASIPTAVSNVLPEVLTSFARRYPKVGVQIFDGNHDYVIGHVRAGLAELGISMDPGDDEDVSFEPLLTDRFVLAAAADGQLAKLSTVSLETLRSERLIIGGRDSGNRLLLELQLGKEISGLRWFYEVEHISSVLALVRRGIGCAVVPSLSISANQTPNVVGIPIEGSSITRRVGVVSHKTISISPMAADFRELLMATVNKRF